MGGGLLSCEQPLNVVSVFCQLLFTVFEHESNRSQSGSPRGSPLRACLHLPFCFNQTNANLCISNASSLLRINSDTMERRQDFVKINGFSLEDVLPFRHGYSSWCSRCEFNIQFGRFEVVIEPSDEVGGFEAAGILRGDLSLALTPRHV